MDFRQVIGQKKILSILNKSVIENRISHTYIFSGPSGIGKKTVANIFAAMLLCENIITDNEIPKTCEKCNSCKMLKSENNADFLVVEIKPDDLSIKIEETRKIISDISIRPMYSKRKVYIINDAEMMTPQAQNCMLKVLENPPSYAVIILTTSNYGALLETVRSRAVRIEFENNDSADISNILKNELKDKKGSEFIVSYSAGNIGTAIKLANSEEFIQIREDSFEILEKLKNKELIDVYESFLFFKNNKKEINSILDIMVLYYRDLLVFQSLGDCELLINSDKKGIILKDAAEYDKVEIIKNIEIIEETRNNLKQNANYQLGIEVMLMKLQEEKH